MKWSWKAACSPIRVLLLIGLILLSSSCSLVFGPVKTATVREFVLTGLTQSGANPLARSPTHAILWVNHPSASPGYQNTDMVYVTQPYRLQHFARHRWTAPIAAMLQPLIVQSFRKYGYFKAVVDAPFVRRFDYRLETHITRLQQVFVGSKSFIDFGLSATLFAHHNQSILGHKDFSVRVAALHSNPYSGVIAANQAVEQALSKLVYFVVHVSRGFKVHQTLYTVGHGPAQVTLPPPPSSISH